MNPAEEIAQETYQAISAQVAEFTREMGSAVDLPESFSLRADAWYLIEAEIDSAAERNDCATTRQFCEAYQCLAAESLSEWRARLKYQPANRQEAA